MDKDNRIKLADIACVDNRKMEGIEELAANIAAIGLLQPILIMTAPEKTEGGKTFGVVDGRRRYRALEHLKREYLEPGQYVIFQGGTNREREAAFCANFARQNLSLAEEVEALKHLGGSQASIAALLGKTEQWVALRQNLANLTGKWVEVLNNPEEHPQWTASKLELIARETPVVQKHFEYAISNSTWSLAEVKDYLVAHHQLLSAAAFDTAACQNCPKRTGAQGVLFAELDDKNDTCLDRDCFRKKTLKIVKKLREEKKLIPFRGDCTDYTSPDGKYAIEVDAKYAYEFEKFRVPKKGEEPNAIIVSGDDMGKLMVAVPRKRQEAATATGEKHEKTVAEREAELKAKRVKLALGKLKEWLESKDNSVDAWIERGGLADDALHELCVKFAVIFGIRGELYGREWDWKLPDLAKITEREFVEAVHEHASRHIILVVTSQLGRMLADIDVKCGDDICGLLFLDWNKLFFEPAVAEIPEPKALIAARIAEKQAKAGKKTAKADKPAKASGK